MLSASELVAQEERKPVQAAAPPTAEALGAVMSLLEACLSTGHMPTPEEAVSDAQKEGGPPEHTGTADDSWRLRSACIPSPACTITHKAYVQTNCNGGFCIPGARDGFACAYEGGTISTMGGRHVQAH